MFVDARPGSSLGYRVFASENFSSFSGLGFQDQDVRSDRQTLLLAVSEEHKSANGRKLHNIHVAHAPKGHKTALLGVAGNRGRGGIVAVFKQLRSKSFAATTTPAAIAVRLLPMRFSRSTT